MAALLARARGLTDSTTVRICHDISTTACNTLVLAVRYLSATRFKERPREARAPARSPGGRTERAIPDAACV